MTDQHKAEDEVIIIDLDIPGGKQEIIDQLHSMLREKEITDILEEVHNMEIQYAHLSDHFPEWHETLEEEEKVLQNETNRRQDQRFKELFNIYIDRFKKFKEKKREEEARNHELKLGLLDKLRTITSTEEKITAAFHAFNEIRDQWNKIGDVPARKYQQLQTDYSHEIDRFYYTINIYRDIKELDYKKNLEAKKELIEKMQGLLNEHSIKRMEILVKAFQEEWDEIGPVHNSDWEGIRKQFREATHKVYKKIDQFYDGIRENMKKNLADKNELIEKMKTIIVLEIRNPKKWNEKTRQILEIQQQWKKTGFASKSDNERTWKEFRELCNQFFDKKHQFFDQLKKERHGHKERKLQIIELTKQLEESDNWKETTKRIIGLQKEWKEIGPTNRKDEQKLWKEFRSHCDTFFEKKKAYFDTIEDRYVENLEAKKHIIIELENFKPKDAEKDLQSLKEIDRKWNQTGHIPKKEINNINQAYRDAMDKVYDKLKLGKEDKILIKFKNRMNNLANLPDGWKELDQEMKRITFKKNKLKQELGQFELNIGFFKSSSGKSSAILDQVNQKMEKAKSEASILEQKIKIISDLKKTISGK
jgi:Domain of Unknown Function (DUF349)